MCIIYLYKSKKEKKDNPISVSVCKCNGNKLFQSGTARGVEAIDASRWRKRGSLQ